MAGTKKIPSSKKTHAKEPPPPQKIPLQDEPTEPQDEPTEPQDEPFDSGTPPTGLILLSADHRRQAIKAPTNGEEVTRAMGVALKRQPAVATLAEINVDTMLHNVDEAEQFFQQARDAYWQYRSLYDRYLLASSAYWSDVQKGWKVAKGAIQANPKLVADFSVVQEHFENIGDKIRASRKKAAEPSEKKD